ncbi:chromogranin-A [Leptodactylus fuscus]|uniref:chromogranin-A n=1 Tax=Leptodactylus fuscus TaxID=238119 RepID=UPI003F4E693F
MTMLYIGVLSIALCAVQVISFPATGRDAEDDTKVMKCIVEVISDTLSKPNPVPTSQDCLETLRGDERIISILRHQNLLKELQELASQGAMERLQKQKKNGGFGEELSSILEKQSNKPLPSEKFQVPSLGGKSQERDEMKRASEEEERKKSSDPTEEENSTEELESNEISKREETSEEEEIDNRITDEINEMELPKDNQEDASEGRTSDEKETMTKKDQEADETEDPEKENHKQDSNETDNEEDDTQREDNSMRPEDFNKDSTSESDNSKETKQDVDTIDCTEENPRSDDVSSKDLEDSKRWNKMDELAKELRAKKCASKSSEDDPDQSMKIPPKEPKYDPSSQEPEDRQQWQKSREDSSETEAPMLKRAEERKEEEGSANRKTEDQELESLAAIEAELENVAHKLHDLRRG